MESVIDYAVAVSACRLIYQDMCRVIDAMRILPCMGVSTSVLARILWLVQTRDKLVSIIGKPVSLEDKLGKVDR